MKKKIMIVSASLIVLVIVGSLISNIRKTQNTNRLMADLLSNIQLNDKPAEEETNTQLTAYMLKELIRPCAKLVTAEYQYCDAAGITDYHDLAGLKIPFTTEEIVFTYTGTIQSGIELKNVSFDVNNDSKIIYITLPAAKKISHEIDLDSFRIEKVHDSWFNAIEADEFLKEANARKRVNEQKAEESGDLYRDAYSSAKDTIQGLFDGAGITKGYRYQYLNAET